jgi:hypothetical protein
VKTKEVKDLSDTTTELLHKDAWGDDEGYTFPEPVGINKLKLKVLVSDRRMGVILNETVTLFLMPTFTFKNGVFLKIILKQVIIYRLRKYSFFKG